VFRLVFRGQVAPSRAGARILPPVVAIIEYDCTYSFGNLLSLDKHIEGDERSIEFGERPLRKLDRPLPIAIASRATRASAFYRIRVIRGAHPGRGSGGNPRARGEDRGEARFPAVRLPRAIRS